MKKYISMILVAAIVLSLCLCFAGCGDNSGKAVQLIVSNHDSSTSIGESYVENLLNEISEKTGGKVVFQYNPGGSLYGGGEAVDAVRKGSADICWNAASITVGVFPVSEFLSLPMTGISCAQMGTEVLRDMMNEIPEVAAEYSDFYVIALHSNNPGQISTNKKIETVNDLKGMLIRAAGPAQSQYINSIGASAQSMSTTEVYEALQKGVVEGCTNDLHNIDCFSLYEVIKYTMSYPVNVTTCFLLMNKDKYNSLPDDVKKVFDEYQTTAADMAAYYWDYATTVVNQKIVDRGGEVYEPSAEVYAHLTNETIKQDMLKWYVEFLTGKGIEAGRAQEICDKCVEICARYADKDYTLPTDLASFGK